VSLRLSCVVRLNSRTAAVSRSGEEKMNRARRGKWGTIPMPTHRLNVVIKQGVIVADRVEFELEERLSVSP
jgi:hypothetical protein